MAFIKGQAFSSDTEVRWEAVREAAKKFGIEVKEQLIGQLEGESSSPLLGYQVTQKLLAGGEPFTALFTFNDISAIGAIHALREAGRRVPEDVSVVGFDDIQSAAFQNPALTTVRQPLREMGMIARGNSLAAYYRACEDSLSEGNCRRAGIDRARQHRSCFEVRLTDFRLS